PQAVVEPEPQAEPETQAQPEPASTPEADVFVMPGASISNYDEPFDAPPPRAVQEAPGGPAIAVTPAPAPATKIVEQAEKRPVANDPVETVIEPEANEELATPEPIDQNVAALDEPQADRLPVEGEPAAVEAAAEPVIDDIQSDQAQSEAPAPEPEAQASVDAAEAPEDKKELQATFNAFVAALKEEEREKELALVTPPPVPLKRPKNIPAPVRTASLSADSDAVTPRVGILLRGLGRNDRNSEIAVTILPPAISLGFAPYVGSAQQWAQEARDLGHEVIIQLPFEPEDYPKTNPGPETILTTSSASQNSSKLRTVLARFDGYNGVTSYYGGKLLQSPDALRPVLEDIKERGLIYISEPDASQALVRKLAGELGVIYGGADIIVDNFQTTDVIQKNLEQLIELARKNGSAIGMAYASRNSIEQLRIWSETVASKGVTLVPVGVLAATPGAS
nr:divergent polysaccharide deacetylase family protein [Hyphomicrobiales bacterium]